MYSLNYTDVVDPARLSPAAKWQHIVAICNLTRKIQFTKCMLHLIHNSGYLDKVYDTVYIRGHMQREAAYRSLGFEEKYSLNWLTGSLAPCLLGTMTGLQKKG